MRPALLVLAALLLAPAGARAQSTPNWILGYVPPPSEWNSWWARKADYPLSSVAVADGLNPLPISSPLYNWGVGVPSTAQISVTDPVGLYIENGGIYVAKASTYGIEDNSVAASFVANSAPNVGASDNNHAQVNGTLFNSPSRLGAANGTDSVALYSGNFWTAPLYTDTTPTFDATHFYPTSDLSASVLGQLRIGMLIQAGSQGSPTANPARWAGAITGWAADGSSVTVSGWYYTGNTASGQVPTNGTTTYINPMGGIWGENTNITVPSGSPSWARATGEEIDIAMDGGNTSPAITDANQSFGLSIQSGGTYAVHDGIIEQGRFLVGLSGKGSFAGISLSPDSTGVGQYGARVSGDITGADFLAAGTGSGNAFEVQNSSGSVNFSVDHSGDVGISGTLTLGTINSEGPASFSNDSVVFADASFGGITTDNISVSGAAYLPTGTAPSGTCSVAGQILGDASNLYWCPSNGGVWKKVALTTN